MCLWIAILPNEVLSNEEIDTVHFPVVAAHTRSGPHGGLVVDQAAPTSGHHSLPRLIGSVTNRTPAHWQVSQFTDSWMAFDNFVQTNQTALLRRIRGAAKKLPVTVTAISLRHPNLESEWKSYSEILVAGAEGGRASQVRLKCERDDAVHSAAQIITEMLQRN